MEPGLARFRAAWVLPVAGPPVPDGEVLVDDGRIVAVGRRGDVGRQARARNAGKVVDLGAVALLPGLVNTHVHLELSWMRGAVPPAGSMPAWARRLIELRRAGGDDPSAIAPAIVEMRAGGTALAGDVSNTLASCGPLGDSPLRAVVFYELLGFATDDPDAVVAAALERIDATPVGATVRMSLAAHAPYSTAPDLFAAIERRVGGRGWPIAVHLAESAEEIRFLQDGGGPWRRLLEELGAWNPRWRPPGCGPVAYLDSLGFLRPGTIAVHAVHLEAAALAVLAGRGVTVVTCPRSNLWTGAGRPPIETFYESGLSVAFGTDSLASVGDLNVFAELAAARAVAPRVPARVLLRSATLDGASALGFGDELGSIEPGKRAELIAVAIEASTRDVEEDLVRGVTPDRIAWA